MFFEYGDDSVAQLGGVHLACEQASNLLTKVLEWGRLMAYLEQSTRYIAYDARIGGRYRYYRDPDVLQSHARHPLRRRHGPAVRHLRRAGARRCGDFFRDHIPKDPADSDFVYRQAIRAKAFDALRGILPGGLAVQRRHLRHRPGLRAAAAAHAGPPAARGPRLRRPDADRAAQGHPVVPAAGSTSPDRGVAWSNYLADEPHGHGRDGRPAVPDRRRRRPRTPRR